MVGITRSKVEDFHGFPMAFPQLFTSLPDITWIPFISIPHDIFGSEQSPSIAAYVCHAKCNQCGKPSNENHPQNLSLYMTVNG
jgi:hypothetical protein